MLDLKSIVSSLVKQFGDDAKVGDVARYMQDEFMIPYEMAVQLIYESVE